MWEEAPVSMYHVSFGGVRYMLGITYVMLVDTGKA